MTWKPHTLPVSWPSAWSSKSPPGLTSDREVRVLTVRFNRLSKAERTSLVNGRDANAFQESSGADSEPSWLVASLRRHRARPRSRLDGSIRYLEIQPDIGR